MGKGIMIKPSTSLYHLKENVGGGGVWGGMVKVMMKMTTRR